jgi:hypothetical protein
MMERSANRYVLEEDWNWLKSLDEKTTHTRDGGPYHSTLDCSSLGTAPQCLAPTPGVECRWFTPPEGKFRRILSGDLLSLPAFL